MVKEKQKFKKTMRSKSSIDKDFDSFRYQVVSEVLTTGSYVGGENVGETDKAVYLPD